HTPGHTDESISIAASDRDFGDEPVAVFTGDALFIGDVGRTDFFPDRAREVAGKLYDSIHEKILPLGDGVILCPAHGAGSVCGSGMADREFSTLGYERRFNPRLQMGRDEFIDYKVSENHYIPPYFKKMEQYNLEGPPVFDNIAEPGPMDAGEFADHREQDDMFMLDVRSPEAHAGALIPGSLGIPLNMVPAFAGYFLPYDRPIGIVAEDGQETETAARYLFRMGYEETVGYLANGLHAWEVSGRDFQGIPEMTARELLERRRNGDEMTVLDVRSIDEFEAGHLPGATHIYVGHLPEKLDEIPGERPVVTFCGSGRRALIAASCLRRNGFEDVHNCLGSMAACRKLGCEVVT
ncbi:MAG: rhodanese-like domain-containing protein, partial [Planctomycetota bacterium]